MSTPRTIAAGDAVWDWDLAADRLYVSPRWCALVGSDAAEIGTSADAWRSRVHPDDLAEVERRVRAAAGGDAAVVDAPHRLRHADGSYRWTSCRVSVERDGTGAAVRLTGVHADVTAATVVDPPTGLPNELLLSEHLARSIERARRYAGFQFALLLVDPGTDAALAVPPAMNAVDPLRAAVARRLETCVRSAEQPRSMRHDDLVARFDGECFAILLDGLKDVGDALLVADRVRGALRAPLPSKTGDVFANPSIGIAVSATGYVRPAEMCRDAGIALHRARLLGGGRAEVFDTAALQAARTELQLEAEFEGALERGEFQVFYQPIVAIADCGLAGVEALARWQHPVLGLVAPADFIPLAERTGFIVPLGRWVLREACARVAAWRRDGTAADGLWVSVNVSVSQLHHGAFADEVAAVLHDVGLPAQRLMLEITESVATDQPGGTLEVLMRLRALGVRLTVDDFGAGHSSLASLSRWPVHGLKTDRGFVRGLEHRREAVELLRAVLQMSEPLGLEVVVEGIESAAQLAEARRLGFQYAQGYLFAPALDAERAVRLLKDGVPKPSSEAARSDGLRRQPHEPWNPAARPGLTSPVLRLLAAAAALLIVIALGFAAMADGPWPTAAVDAGAPPGPAVAAASAADRAGGADAAGAAPAPTTSGQATGATAELAPSRPAAATFSAATVSAPVLHQHRLGGCRGRLVVARGGVRFVPDEDGGDAFSLAAGEFLHALDDDVLTLRSTSRTFRFRAPDGGNRRQGTADVRALAAALTRARTPR
jgi:PAS domain S-box-containing protein